MIGRRIYPDEGEVRFAPGDYGQRDGHWYCCTPTGLLGNLGGHEVTEHADGTITVKPSIKVSGGERNETWHGYLRRGVWEEC